MRTYLGLVVGIALWGAGCTQTNASHCGNLAGDDTCEARGEGLRFCDLCRAERDGCVAQPVSDAACAAPGTSSTTTASGSSSSVGPSTTASSSATPTATAGSTGPQMECGNGVIEGDEICDCDGETCDLDGQDCQTHSGSAGSLSCASDCSRFDPGGCDACGNNGLDPGEECDGSVPEGMTCVSLSDDFGGGNLGCGMNCLFDTTGCCKKPLVGCGDGSECCSGDCGLGAVCL